MELVTLNEGKRDPDTNAPISSAYIPQGDDSDREPFGDVSLIQCLGVTSIPYKPTAEGKAQGICVSVPGLSAVCVAAWDTRTHSIAGNAKPGDTIVHSTGPSKAAQLQLKEEKKQAVLVTRGSDNKQMILVLDGKDDHVTIAAFGHAFRMDKQGVHMSSRNGVNGISITDELVHIKGTVMLGGLAPLSGFSVVQLNQPAIAALNCLLNAPTPTGSIAMPSAGVSIGK
jgi:hypothetical protein